MWSFLPSLVIAVVLLVLAGMVSSGSRWGYLITLMLVALVILENLFSVLQGDLFSVIEICIAAAIIVYLADPDVRSYFFQ